MAGSSPALRNWLIVAVFGIAAALRGCDPDSSPDEPRPGGEVRGQVLEALWPDVVEPALTDFVDAAGTLSATADAWGTEPDAVGAREATRVAFQDAMDAWQVVELLQFGPTGSVLSVAGGTDYRDAIYSWPTSLACRVDQEIVADAFADEGWITTQLPNALGLDAMEYLVFDEDDTNDCGPLVEINTGPWDALDLDTLNARRAAYAAVLAADVAETAQQLLAAWHPDSGGFADELASAGEGSTVYPEDQDALDDVFAALFYVELMVKDRKLARPLGLRDCLDPLCPDDLELRWSDGPVEAIEANLIGTRTLYMGGEGVGFDDLLAEIDQSALHDSIIAAIDAADAAVLAVPTGANDTIYDDPTVLQDLHDAIKDLTDLIKGDFATSLLLTVPQEAAGDND